MGTEYYLLRPDNNTLFELGKGLVNPAFEHLEHVAQTLEHQALLTCNIALALEEYYIGVEETGAHRNLPDFHYAAFVAEKAVAWADGKPVRFRDEHQIEDEREHLSITGSRYKEE